MTIININPCESMRDGIIGHVRENGVTQLVFDLSAWVSEYGLGTVALSVMRQGDLVPYPVPIAIVDGKATWTISATDTAKYGRIKAQLSYVAGTKVKKTNVYTLLTKESLPVDGDAPEAYESWLEILQDMTAETAANAESARQSATSASESAQSAASDAQTASTAAENAEESADEAEYYADLAAQHAERAGYVIFDVNEQTGEAIATVTDAVDEAMTFAVDEANGDLEVTLI